MRKFLNPTVVKLFVVWRILLFLPLFISYKFIVLRPGFEYVTLLKFIPQGNTLLNPFIYPWANFDGIYYLYIAASGYTVDNAGFFPFYSLLIHFLGANAKIFSIQQFSAALILSSAFFALGLLYFYKLLLIDYQKSKAFPAILFLLVFPTSFFFAAIYPESLFFLLTLASFYFARKGRWLLSGLCGLLLTATRIVGISIFPALILEFYLQNKTLSSSERKLRLFSKKIAPVFLTPFGVISYLVFDYLNFGNLFQFVKAQGALHNNRSEQLVLFPQTVYRYIKIFSEMRFGEYEWWIALLELFSFIFASIFLYLAWRKNIRLSYVLFGVLALLIPASTGTFTGMPRYILVLFPIFIALGLIKNKFIKISLIIFFAILSIILFSLFSKGYYVA